MRKWTALLLLAVTSLNGCFSYVPAREQAPSQASRVRVHLVQPQQVRLSQVTANDVALVDGEIVSATDEEVSVSALWLVGRGGYETPGENATVRIPRANVARMEVRRPSLLRTGAILGAAAVLAAVFAAATLNGSADGGGGGNTSQ